MSEPGRTIQVPFTEARLITGRCTLHGCDLKLVEYADEGLDTILDAWHCPGLYTDPDLLALQAEGRELSRRHPLGMDQWPQAAVDQRKRYWLRGTELRVRCERSWVLIIPVTEGGAITCPRCSRTSHNPDDVREGYCGNCRDWTRVDTGTPEIT